MTSEVRNVATVDQINIDIDVPYERFKGLYGCSKLKKLIKDLPDVKRSIIRESSNGRVHVRIFFKHPIDLFESFLVRGFLRDDAYKLRFDLERYYKYRDKTRSIFVSMKNTRTEL
jgi:hypothetical protein